VTAVCKRGSVVGWFAVCRDWKSRPCSCWSRSAALVLARRSGMVATQPCASGRWAAVPFSTEHHLSRAFQHHANQGSTVLPACLIEEEYPCCACLCIISRTWILSHCSDGGGRASPGQRDASLSPRRSRPRLRLQPGRPVRFISLLCQWRPCSEQHSLHMLVLTTPGVHSWPAGRPAFSARR
jgi:hypothetical protein